MSAVELLFLVLGLCLGVAVGAALLDLVRARPTPREVRLTITRNALPGRDGDVVPLEAGGAAVAVASAERTVADVGRVPVSVEGGVDPAYAAIRQAPPVAEAPAQAGARAAVGAASLGQVVEGERPGGGGTVVAMAQAGPDAEPSVASGGGTSAAAVDPCAAQRRLTEERCAMAGQAAERAVAAADAQRSARRAYDEVSHRIDEARRRADPRAVNDAKEVARRAFRSGREHATTRADLELAATRWLTEIDRINEEVREATLLIAREQDDAATLASAIERLGLEADAARITAEAANEACQEARAALAACESGEPARSMPGTGDVVAPLPARLAWEHDESHPPQIVRLLHGDEGARERIVLAFAGPDPDQQRGAQIWLSELIDAILASSIEAAVLDFPDEHPFWSGFDRSQSRDIVVALASLGYRFDGLGGFVAERVPSLRDLSLAVGYAALDPLRIRHWPTATEMPDLFREVTVAADEFLVTRAPDLELSEMVGALGRRSERLAELWNRWGRLRPLLLETGG